jgi:hypothetical protein
MNIFLEFRHLCSTLEHTGIIFVVIRWYKAIPTAVIEIAALRLASCSNSLFLIINRILTLNIHQIP